MARCSSNSGRCPKRCNSRARVALEKHFMKLNVRNWFGVAWVALVVSSTLFGFRARALEPETLFNFQVSLGTLMGSLIEGPDGNFYGTTANGGPLRSGTVFRVTPFGIVTSLVSLDGSSLGAFGVAGLTLGPEGNLYGITSFGGTANRGTIFKMTPGGSLTTLHSFQETEGSGRQARLALGPDRNLYGTSQDGGGANMGTIFKITTNGIYTTLVSFNGANGAVPFA